MPDNAWQYVIVALCIAAAFAVVVRRAWQVIRGQSAGCATGCGKCPSRPLASQPLVSLDLGTQSRKPS
jgi:hypothetical protein